MSLIDRLRARALAYPEVGVETACSREAFRARKKGFLYLEDKDGTAIVLLKLGPSLPTAAALAAARPGEVEVGRAGWVTARLGPDAAPLDGIDDWLDESYRLNAPKALVRQLG